VFDGRHHVETGLLEPEAHASRSREQIDSDRFGYGHRLFVVPAGAAQRRTRTSAGLAEHLNDSSREIFPKMAESGESAPAIMEREGLKQISDSGALARIVDEVIAANPKQVAEYKAGKTVVLKFLVGQVMKASRGQANPAAVNELFAEKLK
jgi:hypothetical protein